MWYNRNGDAGKRKLWSLYFCPIPTLNKEIFEVFDISLLSWPVHCAVLIQCTFTHYINFMKCTCICFHISTLVKRVYKLITPVTFTSSSRAVCLCLSNFSASSSRAVLLLWWITLNKYCICLSLILSCFETWAAAAVLWLMPVTSQCHLYCRSLLFTSVIYSSWTPDSKQIRLLQDFPKVNLAQVG